MRQDPVVATIPPRPVVGVLHPGAMGAAVGSALRPRAGAVIWAAAGRSHATSKRAELADLVAVPDLTAVARRSDVIISVCPPHAAREVADEVAGALDGRCPVYVDANAVSPATVRAVADRGAREVAAQVREVRHAGHVQLERGDRPAR